MQHARYSPPHGLTRGTRTLMGSWSDTHGARHFVDCCSPLQRAMLIRCPRKIQSTPQPLLSTCRAHGAMRPDTVAFLRASRAASSSLSTCHPDCRPVVHSLLARCTSRRRPHKNFKMPKLAQLSSPSLSAGAGIDGEGRTTHELASRRPQSSQSLQGPHRENSDPSPPSSHSPSPPYWHAVLHDVSGEGGDGEAASVEDGESRASSHAAASRVPQSPQSVHGSHK